MRTHKRVLVLSFALLVVAILTATALNGQNQNKSGLKTDDEATQVQEGVMTEKQRQHSKLYKDRGIGKKLTDIARTNGSATIIVEPPMPTYYPDSPTLTSGQYLKELACKADAIVIGKVVHKTSQLTEEEDFVFTDYEVSIEEIVKDNPASQIGTNTNITMTMPGGVVRLDGRVISARLAAQHPFNIGSRYLSFLRYIPESGSYTAINSRGSFLLQNGKVNKMTEGPLVRALENRDEPQLISELREAVTQGCGSVNKGEKK